MSEANRTDISYLKESTNGVTPSAGDFRKLPFTGAGDFSFNPLTGVSETIRQDRQKDDLLLLGIEAGGGLDFELAHRQFDDILEGALFEDWKRNDELFSISNIEAGELTATNIPEDIKENSLCVLKNNNQEVVIKINQISGDSITFNGDLGDLSLDIADDVSLKFAGYLYATGDITEDTANKTLTIAGENLTDKIAIGDFILIQPLGYYRVRSINFADDSNTIIYDVKKSKVDNYTYNVGNGNAVLLASVLKNGVVKKSFSFLERFHTVTGKNNAIYSGLYCDALSLELNAQSIITGNFNFMGLNSRFLENEIPSDRIKEPFLGNILNSSSNVSSLLLNGEEVEGPNFIQTATIELNNNLRRLLGVGHLGSVDIGSGTCDLTGTLTTYFGSSALAEQVITNDETSLTLFIEDDEGKGFLIDIPKIKFTEGSPTIEGENTDITLELGYRALRHKFFNYQIKICSFDLI